MQIHRDSVHYCSFFKNATVIVVGIPLCCLLIPVMTHGSDIFEKNILPIFERKCVRCHGPTKQRGGLKLDSRASAITAGNSGIAAIVPGNSRDSLLIDRVSETDPDMRMPLKDKVLTADEIEVLRNWIDAGAVWPDDAGIESGSTELTVSDLDRNHWSFRPLANREPPDVRRTGWVRTPVDRFILARLEQQGMLPSAAAGHQTLIRRLWFDLIGLPPPPAEVGAFVRDASADAHERLVERLLADPHYGERWARHWLDVARYADTAGFEEDRSRPHAYQYRDFVIRSFNEDLPWDTFLHWQIAGDLIAPDDPHVFAATGFLTAAPDVRPDFVNFRKKDRFDELDDLIATTGVAMLGLTVGCARCHDHKFDPVPMRDYYGLQAFFTSTKRSERPFDANEGAAYELRRKVWDARLQAAGAKLDTWLAPHVKLLREQRIAALPATAEETAVLLQPVDEENAHQKALLERFRVELKIEDDDVQEVLTEDQQKEWNSLTSAVAEIKQAEPEDVTRVLSVQEGPRQPTHLLVRGNPDAPADEMEPGVLSVLASTAVFGKRERKSEIATVGDHLVNHKGPAQHGELLTRRELAFWLTDVENGAGALAARVIVNRIWRHHFGRGLVTTPGDFGVRGDAPTHPELLDWLAAELVRNGWRIRHIHRLILNSATWRQSSVDPEFEQLYAGRKPLRVEAEVLRDSILSVSGCLNTQQFGPAVKPRMDPDAISIVTDTYEHWPKDVVDGPDTWRRSIYVFVKRTNLLPLLLAFDLPDAIGSCSRRHQSCVAHQALMLMNDVFVREQSRYFAQRVRQDAGRRVQNQVHWIWNRGYSRRPSEAEIAQAVDFLNRQTAHHTADGVDCPDLAAVTDLCQAVISSSEFAFIE